MFGLAQIRCGFCHIPSLLAKAFYGELVPQKPNDEPADNLLERISAGTYAPHHK